MGLPDGTICGPTLYLLNHGEDPGPPWAPLGAWKRRLGEQPDMMAEAYGRALIEERMKPRRHAEIAAYVRHEYGRGTGPEFLLAQVANAGVSGPPRRRFTESVAVFNALARTLRALVVGNRNRHGKVADPTR